MFPAQWEHLGSFPSASLPTATAAGCILFTIHYV